MIPPNLLLSSACLLVLPAAVVAQTTIPIQSPQVEVLGRTLTQPGGAIRLAYPGTGIVFRVKGAAATLHLSSTTAHGALTVVVDHGEPRLVPLQQGVQDVALLSPEIAHETPASHTIAVYKRTETWQGLLDFQSIALDPGEELVAPAPLPTRKLLFIGDSVTCGAGVDTLPTCGNPPGHFDNDAFHAYGLELGRRLDAQSDLVCYGGRGLQRDYKGNTTAAGTLNAPAFVDLAIATDDPSTRAPWDASAYIPNAIVISLGTNDFSLQPTKPLDGPSFIADYVKLLQHLRSEYPNSVILITEGAIVTDPLLRQYVQAAATRMHDTKILWTAATHYPGRTCNAHPTAAEHQHIADDLEPLLRNQLHW